MAEDTLWLTMGPDAAELVRDAAEQGLLEGTFDAIDSTDSVLLFEVRRDQLADITRLMHEKSHRCGGYIAHESYDSGMAALREKQLQKAVNQQLVNYSIDNGAVVEALLPALDSDNLNDIIEHMSTAYTNRFHTTTNGAISAMWLRDTWAGYIDAAGREDASVELYQHSATNQPSVILTIRGDWAPDEVVVIGGHLDSTAGWSTGSNTPAPGADDDASGIATLSEVARVLLTEQFRPDRTVMFMGYAAEEVGLVGSGEIANDFLAQGINVVGVMQLDMTNYQGSVNDIVLMSDYSNQAQNTFIGDLIDIYLGLQWTYSSCGYGCSDHASWTNAGYAASIPFESLMGNYNPNIHTAYDTFANMDITGSHAMKFARLATAYVAELAKGDFEDDWTPPPGAATDVYSGTLGQYETRYYGPFPVVPESEFGVNLANSGYADVYVRFGAAPTVTEYDCRPYIDGPRESCGLLVPATETEAYVMVRGHMASYSLTVAYFDGVPPPQPINENFPGTVSQGQEQHYGGFPVSPGTTFSANMTGTGDGDLYVRFGAPPTQSNWDCRPYTGTTTENCTRTVPPGQTQAYVMIHGFSDATYNLSVTYTP